jgi:hypothetical protein
MIFFCERDKMIGGSDHTELHVCVTNSTKQMMMEPKIAHGRRRKKTPIRPLRLVRVRRGRDEGAQNKRCRWPGPFSGMEKAGPGQMKWFC